MNPSARKARNGLRLRAAAETQLPIPPSANTLPAADLLHQLQVHQIELEIQNEALRQAQNALEASRDRYVDLFEFAPVGYLTLSADGLIAEINLTAINLLGMDRTVLLQRRFAALVMPQDLDRWYQLFLHVTTPDAKGSVELMLRRGDGTVFQAQLDCGHQKVGAGETAVRIALADISERKQAEQALRERETGEFRRAILDSIDAQIAVLDRDGVIVAVNDTWRRFALDNSAQPGQPAKNTQIGGNYLDICLASRGDLTAGALEARDGILAVLGNRLPTFSLEYPCHSPAEQRWFAMTVTPLAMGSGGVVIVHTNITERNQSAAALQASEQKYRALLEHAADAVVISDMQGIVIEINATAETLLGYDRKELIGEHIRMIHPQTEMPGIASAFAQFADSDFVATGPCHVLTKLGLSVPVEINSMAIMVGERKVAMGIFRDLSEQQAREAQRLRDEAAHRNALVREVNHRIKNSLQGVAGILGSLAQRQPLLAPALDDVIGQVGSIALVHGLYGSASQRRVSLCDLVAEVAHNTETLWQTEIAVAVEQNCPHCILDEREAVPLALVLNELLANACKHGAGKNEGEKPTIALEYAADYSRARVRITNPGRLPPVFDFGKRLGLGTGLGLVAVLLSKEGASLDLTQQAAGVETLLSLSAPVFAERLIEEGTAA